MATDTTTLSDRIESLQDRLHKYAQRHATNAVQADDLIQIAVEEILTHCKPTDNDTYMLRLADWRMKNAVKRENTYSIRIEDADREPESEDENEFEIVDVTGTPEEFIIKSEMSESIMGIFNNLDTFHKQILTCLFDGLSQREIASELHTTQRRVFYHTQKIRNTFEQAGLSSAM